jgi:acid phosphatase (class A)
VKPAAALVACVVLSGCATPGARPVDALPPGYLSTDALDRLAAGAGPPPALDSTSRAAFERVLPGSDRWWLAIVHAETRPPEAAQHFDCVLGARLADGTRPALTRAMNRLLVDAAALGDRLGREGRRDRPVAVLTGLEPCQRTTDQLRRSNGWPATAAIVGAAWGELFAGLAPDRADGARRIGREIGFSRAVCRMNWPADVEAGHDIGRALYADASATAGFAEGIETARAELQAARALGLTNPGCAAERRALGITPGAG